MYYFDGSKSILDYRRNPDGHGMKTLGALLSEEIIL